MFNSIRQVALGEQDRVDLSQSSQLSTKMVSRSESKKRGCDDLDNRESASATGKFWSGSALGDDEQDQELDLDLEDPRKDENRKIQKRKGFLKDRECKALQNM